MIGLFEALARPLLRMLDPEDAHRLAIRALKFPPFVKLVADDPRLAVRAFGLNFPNPIGMAAGFDKHAEVPDALLALGFGFVEVGTVTPEPQAGNPRPRIFRLPRDEGVINRLGFNSEGADAVLRRLAARANAGGVVGVNVGANRESVDRIADYVRLIETFAPVVSYFSVNISSPNTPGLRELQQAKVFDDLLARVMDARSRMSKEAGTTPVLIKIAPDVTLSELDDLVGGARKHRVDGMIIGNTTLARPPGLRDQGDGERGGWPVRAPAFCAFYPNAGGDLCAGRGCVPAHRRRRHRFRRDGAGEDQGRGVPDPALQRARVPRAAARRRHQVRSLRCATPRRPYGHRRARRRGRRRDDGGGVAGVIGEGAPTSNL